METTTTKVVAAPAVKIQDAKRNEMRIPIINVADQLSALIKGGTTFITITYVSPKVNTRITPFGNIRKRATVNGVLGYDYEKSVNNQREREQGDNAPEFKVAKRKWGRHLNRAIVVHTPAGETELKYYVVLKCQRVIDDPEYFNAKGETLTAEQVAPYIRKPSKSNTQNVEREVIHREFRLDNVESINATRKADDLFPKIAMTLIPTG